MTPFDKPEVHKLIELMGADRGANDSAELHVMMASFTALCDLIINLGLVKHGDVDEALLRRLKELHAERIRRKEAQIVGERVAKARQ